MKDRLATLFVGMVIGWVIAQLVPLWMLVVLGILVLVVAFTIGRGTSRKEADAANLP